MSSTFIGENYSFHDLRASGVDDSNQFDYQYVMAE